MPYSSSDGKDWLGGRICMALRYSLPRFEKEGDSTYHLLAPRVLDIGAGSGTYADLVQRSGPLAHLTAVEIHAPYVTMFGLRGRYDEVIVADVRGIELPEAEVVILGDVLEHMPLADAVAVWEKARRAARTAVFLSLPIVPWPQGPQFDNEHEAHVEDWSHPKVVRNLPGITRWSLTPTIGAYEAWLLEDMQQ